MLLIHLLSVHIHLYSHSSPFLSLKYGINGFEYDHLWTGSHTPWLTSKRYIWVEIYVLIRPKQTRAGSDECASCTVAMIFHRPSWGQLFLQYILLPVGVIDLYRVKVKAKLTPLNSTIGHMWLCQFPVYFLSYCTWYRPSYFAWIVEPCQGKVSQSTSMLLL